MLHALVLLAAGSCEGDSPAAAPRCDWALPATCPGAAPSYAGDVAPLIASRCLPACHAPGGISQMQTLGSYSQIFSKRGTVLSQIYTCKMPPAPTPALPADEGKVILDWLVCGAPNN